MWMDCGLWDRIQVGSKQYNVCVRCSYISGHTLLSVQVDRIIFCVFLETDLKIYTDLLPLYFPMDDSGMYCVYGGICILPLLTYCAVFLIWVSMPWVRVGAV